MTALWIAVGFIVGSIFGIVTTSLAITAKNADRQMCECNKDLSVEKESAE